MMESVWEQHNEDTTWKCVHLEIVKSTKKAGSGVQTVKSYGGTKNTTDSGAVVVSVRKGPLGFLLHTHSSIKQSQTNTSESQ